MANCLVAGAGGFIGGHIVKRLLKDGHWVEGVDIKPECDWWQVPEGECVNALVDLREYVNCLQVCRNIDVIYNLACDMGGIGFIENNKADCMTSVLINTNLLRAACERSCERYFYSSSACVYHAKYQNGYHGISLTEGMDTYEDGYLPEDGYGWEKLFSERMCRHYREDYGIQTVVARFHNIYGPHGSWNDGREKAPAALCRKVAVAKLYNEPTIEVWGDGTALRSFCWIDDCVEGIIRLTEQNVSGPVNVGSDEITTVDNLVSIIEKAAGYGVGLQHDTTKPIGVHGRNSNNTLIRNLLGWQPTTTLEEGISKLYPWIEEQVKNSA